MTHYNPFPTDAEIDAIAMANAEETRKRLTAERDAAVQAAFAAIEEQMTDANKATENAPAGFTLTVSGAQATGKTTLLLFLLEALADAGVMTGAATKALTADPCRFLYNNFAANEGHYEAVNLDLDLSALLAERHNTGIENRSFYVDGTRLIGKLSYDELVTSLMHPETIKMWLINVTSEMVDKCFDEHGKMMPITLVIDPY